MLLVVRVISIPHSSIGCVDLFFPSHHTTCQPLYYACQLTCILVCASSCVSKRQKLDKKPLSRIHTGDSETGREREIARQLNVSIDMHSFVCNLLRVKCQKLDKKLCQGYTLVTQAVREGDQSATELPLLALSTRWLAGQRA